uniref:Uncharacterized protein n=2 Tax=Lotharella oceanica TaxID=641309 RepID=A0A7S2X7N5_9EUKA|mmetsp:Transcript_15419/g.29295  ORF Transcript_15419/g.29295 Transcript_15419/m.29295 type:complete len:252 (+) Transcript_15419:121-876(+)|eukprot:CAMPEP_0170167242 /NCGR_PEP_ID=MMETSP0040_2-20121228/704_1 /TAXON_ID=641309 /ORGANISM="Lotharella oceanica, Strain CCMP622" /LENGTH=251 /DNA_ID=CAMNT_0010405209 /DNA_START=182 /DNA_END=937 /DNA_ORIENTATION=+
MPSTKRKTLSESPRARSRSPASRSDSKDGNRPKRSRHFYDCTLCDKLRRELRHKKSSELKRTLEIDYWKRTDDCSRRKREHMERVESTRDVSMEEWIFQTTLKGTDHAMEKNPFPYQTPKNVEHWTLWASHEMERRQIERYIYHFIQTEQQDVEAWEYDENSHRSIDIFHVHVYLKFRDGCKSADSKCCHAVRTKPEYDTPTRDELQGVASVPTPGLRRAVKSHRKLPTSRSPTSSPPRSPSIENVSVEAL